MYSLAPELVHNRMLQFLLFFFSEFVHIPPHVTSGCDRLLSYSAVVDVSSVQTCHRSNSQVSGRLCSLELIIEIGFLSYVINLIRGVSIW